VWLGLNVTKADRGDLCTNPRYASGLGIVVTCFDYYYSVPTGRGYGHPLVKYAVGRFFREIIVLDPKRQQQVQVKGDAPSKRDVCLFGCSFQLGALATCRQAPSRFCDRTVDHGIYGGVSFGGG
jgi:hypothetical protein